VSHLTLLFDCGVKLVNPFQLCVVMVSVLLMLNGSSSRWT